MRDEYVVSRLSAYSSYVSVQKAAIKEAVVGKGDLTIVGSK
jgi:hypothetical protein